MKAVRAVGAAVWRVLVSKEMRPAELMILRAVAVAGAAALGFDISHWVS